MSENSRVVWVSIKKVLRISSTHARLGERNKATRVLEAKLRDMLDVTIQP